MFVNLGSINITFLSDERRVNVERSYNILFLDHQKKEFTKSHLAGICGITGKGCNINNSNSLVRLGWHLW